MTKKVRILAAILVLVLGGGIAIWRHRSASPQATSDKTVWTLRQEWLPQMTFSGELIARRRGFYGLGMDVEVRPGGFENDPIKLVASGVDDFGVAGAERVLQANEHGASLVVVGVANQVSPTVFLALTDHGIRKPQDFAGHTVGVLSGSNTEVVYRALLAKAGVDRHAIREIEISYDLLGFIKGSFDVLPAFVYDEPISLKKQGVPFVTIDPQDYGVRVIGNVYFTTRRTLEAHGTAVSRFVQGLKLGWEAAFANPDEAMSVLAVVDPKLDLGKEKESLLVSKRYFVPDGRRLLAIDRSDWDREVQLLLSIGYLKEPTNLAGSLAPEIVEAAYKGAP